MCQLCMKTLALSLVFSAVCFIHQAGAAEPNPYPLKTCIVTDDPLESMSKGITIVYEGQEIRLCCRECKQDFKDNPEKFLKKLDPGK